MLRCRFHQTTRLITFDCGAQVGLAHAVGGKRRSGARRDGAGGRARLLAAKFVNKGRKREPAHTMATLDYLEDLEQGFFLFLRTMSVCRGGQTFSNRISP